jgi:putative oxidoreductase
LRRLFSMFARGWPGVGLLLLRLVVGIALIGRAVAKLSSGPSFYLAALCVLAIGLAVLLLAGFWIPVAGTLVAVLEICQIPWHRGTLSTYIFMGTIAAALALLGAGLLVCRPPHLRMEANRSAFPKTSVKNSLLGVMRCPLQVFSDLLERGFFDLMWGCR